MRLDANLLRESINPENVALYLAAHGWEPARRTELFSTWLHDGEEPQHLFLPMSREPYDYAERLYDVITGLARAEDRDPEAVFTNLRYAGADLVRLRLQGPGIGVGEVPITDGASLFEGARRMMLAAACAAVEPRPIYGPKKPATATRYLDGVRFGQTETSSYVVTVISELSFARQETFLPAEAPAPFERRVTATLVDALHAVKDAAERVRSEAADISLFSETVTDGVSANLCDAIVQAGTEDESADVNVAVDWASVWPAPEEEQPAVAIGFDPSEVRVVEKAAAFLRQVGPIPDVEVEGFVSRLDRGTGDQVGTIVIEGVAAGERRNVHVELGGEQYHRAISAHDERRRVSIHGTLVKEGKYWMLTDPGPLEVAGDEL